MDRWVRHSKVKGLALVAAAVGLVVVDVVVLTLVVIPLVTSMRMSPTGGAARPTQEVEVALILPTRDPRTPWPTRTPTPTATPWRIATPAPVPPVAEGSSVPAESALSPVALQSAGETISSTLETILSPALQADAGAVNAAASNAGLPTGTSASSQAQVGQPGDTSGADPNGEPSAVPTDSPTGGATATPPGEATATPVADASETPPPTEPTGTRDDLPDFEGYLRVHQNAVADQPFDIVSLTKDDTSGAGPRFVLEVVGNETGNAFAAQPAAAVLNYGLRFLDDAKRYLGGEQCGIAVKSTYKTTNVDACSSKPGWCQVGDHDPIRNSWTVTWTYVRGDFTGGPYAVESWKTEP